MQKKSKKAKEKSPFFSLIQTAEIDVLFLCREEEKDEN
jgi:hypothetical protein